MKIALTSVSIDDYDKALKFYTDKLGFVKKRDIAGRRRALDHRRLARRPQRHRTAAGTERHLSGHESPQGSAGHRRHPLHRLSGDDIQQEYERLKALGVEFTMEPTNMGMTTLAILDDTCGNLIQIFEIDGG